MRDADPLISGRNHINTGLGELTDEIKRLHAAFVAERALADDLVKVLMDIDADYDDEDKIAAVLARYQEARR